MADEADTKEPVIEVDTGDNAYPWSEDTDEDRRCFVLEKLAHSSDLAQINLSRLIHDMDILVQWLKEGKVSLPNGKGGSVTPLKPV